MGFLQLTVTERGGTPIGNRSEIFSVDDLVRPVRDNGSGRSIYVKENGTVVEYVVSETLASIGSQSADIVVASVEVFGRTDTAAAPISMGIPLNLLVENVREDNSGRSLIRIREDGVSYSEYVASESVSALWSAVQANASLTATGVSSPSIPYYDGSDLVDTSLEYDSGNDNITQSAGQRLMPDGTNSAPAYSFTGDTDSGFYRAGADDVRIAVNGTDAIQFGTEATSIEGDLTMDRGATTISASELNLLDDMVGRTGTDNNFVTGVAGTNGNVLEWDVNGDAVDSGVASSDMVQSVDSTQQAISVSEWGLTEWSSTTLYVQTSSNTVQSGTLTDILNAGVGSREMPADFFVPGKVLKIRSRGTVSLGSGDTLEMAVDIGGASVTTGAVFSSITPSSQNYEVEADVVCRTTGTSGTAYLIGFVRVMDSSGNEQVAQLPGSSISLDTTVLNSVQVKAALSDTTNDSITSQLGYITKEA